MKILKTFALLVILSCVLIGLQNCQKDHFPAAPVCFQEEVFPIIISNCTQSDCHNSFDKKKDIDLTTYEGILGIVKKGNYKSSKLYTVLVTTFGNVMPQKPYSPLSDEQVTTIARWIQEGATDIGNCQSACDTTSVSFSTNVFPIIQNYCNGCHSTNSTLSSIKLSTYNDIKLAVSNGSLIGSVNYDQGFVPMPKNGNQLSQCKIDIIQKWINDGAPNN